MSARTVLTLRQQPADVQVVLVERTWELAGYLDEIQSAELTAHDAQQRIAEHTWRARADVPAILEPHIDADYLGWSARVAWAADGHTSRWRIVPHALRDAVSCAADVALVPALGGRATRITIDLDVRGLDGRQGVATIANRIVLTNWQKLVEAAGRKLSQAAAPAP